MSFRTQDAYYARLAGRAGPILRSRLEAAASLAACLINAAVRRAEELSAAERAASPRANGVESVVAESQTGFVGSRNSEVFHRSTCIHVARIKLSNQVQFPTVEAARRAGRTPCKSCKPDQQNDPDDR